MPSPNLQKDQPSDNAASETGAPPMAPGQRLQALRSIQSNAVVPASTTAPFRFWRWIYVLAGIIGVLLTLLFGVAFWRLHGPQNTELADGWTHIVDRDWGFEVDLPNWNYSLDAQLDYRNYFAQFKNARHSSVKLTAQKWGSSLSKATRRKRTQFLIDTLKKEQERHTVTVIEDRSSNPLAPSLEFVESYGPNSSASMIWYRYVFFEDRLVIIAVHDPNDVPKDELKRALSSLKWISP